MAVAPFAGTGAALRLLGVKLFTNYSPKLMSTGLENVEMFRGECVRLQAVRGQDSNRAACV